MSEKPTPDEVLARWGSPEPFHPDDNVTGLLVNALREAIRERDEARVETEKRRQEIRNIIKYAQYGNYRNGVTHNGIDEGEEKARDFFEEATRALETTPRHTVGDMCENCLGVPAELPQGCVCQFSAHPGTMQGMVDGFRRTVILMTDYICSHDLEDGYLEWRKSHVLGKA